MTPRVLEKAGTMMVPRLVRGLTLVASFASLAVLLSATAFGAPGTLVTDVSAEGDPPQIVQVDTFVEGVMVYFRLSFTDPNNDAVGFGFRGANGSGWGEERLPFSNPSYGRVSGDQVEYPFNHDCGGPSEYESDVEAWIYDSTGLQSESVFVHLSCRQAGASVEQYLSDISPVASTVVVNTGTAYVNGEPFLHSLILSSHYNLTVNEVEYDIGRDWQSLQATVGVSDESPSEYKLRFEVFGDGRPLYDRTLGLGESEAVDLDVSNVLRLKLVVSFLAPPYGGGFYYGVWGDARLEAGG